MYRYIYIYMYKYYTYISHEVSHKVSPLRAASVIFGKLPETACRLAWLEAIRSWQCPSGCVLEKKTGFPIKNGDFPMKNGDFP